nr:hypothetical protein [Tanacetum cinerariifolium]
SLSDEAFSKEIFLNPLFEEEIISMRIDQHHFNAKSDLIESLLNRDSSIISSSSKIDSLLDEFAGELTLLKSIPPGINETDCHPENEIRLTKRLFDSLMEEIDLTFNLDDPMPPSIKEGDHDSERDILILNELPSNYSFSLPEKSPDLSSHQSLENFKLSAKCPMMIHGKNIHIMDVPLFHVYPLDQLNLLHLAGSQPMLKSSYNAEDGVIISIPPLVGGAADVVIDIKGMVKNKREKDKFRTKPDQIKKKGKLWGMSIDTILAMESDEFIKSCVENLVPNPSESEVRNGCDVPACFTTFSNILFDADYDFDSVDDQSLSDEDFPKEIFSNLFEEEIISMRIDHNYFNAESDLIESLLNRDSFTISSSSKIDSLLDEFAGELTLLKLILPGIDETDCHPENEIRLTKRLFDSLMEEIDLTFNPDDLMLPSIKEDDHDSERDILILNELPSNYSLSLPINESFHFEIPLFSRPLAIPPDGNT